MTVAQLKRPFESDGDDHLTSPQRKRPRGAIISPVAPQNRSPSRSPEQETVSEDRCTSPTSEEEVEVKCTPPPLEKEDTLLPALQKDSKEECPSPAQEGEEAEADGSAPAPQEDVEAEKSAPEPEEDVETEGTAPTLEVAPAVELPVLSVVQKTDNWPGLAGFQNWAILGDSLSYVEGDDIWYAHLQNRLGGKWPANVNNCGERLASVEDDIALQLDSAAEFAETDPGNTLFLIWLGTYDCLNEWNRLDNFDGEPSELGLQTLVSMMFDGVRLLYGKGARNFVLFDVPPVDRSRHARELRDDDGEPLGFDVYMAQCVSIWNTALELETRDFALLHPDVSIFVVSTHALFTRLLDDQEDDEDDEAGDVWLSADDFPFSDPTHQYMAKEIALAFERVVNEERKGPLRLCPG